MLPEVIPTITGPMSLPIWPKNEAMGSPGSTSASASPSRLAASPVRAVATVSSSGR